MRYGVPAPRLAYLGGQKKENTQFTFVPRLNDAPVIGAVAWEKAGG